ncbi:MAG: hypothetical protein ABFD75_07370 [Smithella sp.]
MKITHEETSVNRILPNKNNINDNFSFKERLIKFFKKSYLIIFSVILLSPTYYDIIAKIPPANELNKSQGQLIYDPGNGMYSYSTGLKTQDGESIYFACNGSLGYNIGCIPGKFNRQSLQGKQATITWYIQPLILGVFRGHNTYFSCKKQHNGLNNFPWHEYLE